MMIELLIAGLLIVGAAATTFCVGVLIAEQLVSLRRRR